MSKHTPGPWSRDKYGNVVDSEGGRIVMRSVAVACSGSDEYIALAEANTDLATAAPDLLEMLEEARRTLEMWRDVAPAVSLCADIDKAIARAKGESK